MLWVSPKPYTAAHSLSPSGRVGWNSIGARKFTGLGINGLTGKAKAACTKQNKESIHYFPPAGSDWSFPGEQGFIIPNSYLGNPVPNSESPPFFLPPAFTAEHSLLPWGIFLWSGWFNCPGCPLPTCAPPAYWLAEQQEKQEKTLTLCKQCSTLTKTVLSVLSQIQNIAPELLWSKLTLF